MDNFDTEIRFEKFKKKDKAPPTGKRHSHKYNTLRKHRTTQPVYIDPE